MRVHRHGWPRREGPPARGRGRRSHQRVARAWRGRSATRSVSRWRRRPGPERGLGLGLVS
ncbi:hypothetical protein ACFPRL_10375 [Pseudoclavibacter helvolus]